MSDEKSAEQQVMDVILSKVNARQIRPRIFISPALYEKFIKEVEPRYKQQYGGLVTDMDATLAGYDNVLYQGCAVCIGVNESEESDV